MLNFVNIQNFKTLLESSFPIAPLNIFSGLNGMGKSSLIQSLLLLRQSYEDKVLNNRGLILNGNYLNLGTGKDVLSSCCAEEKIKFTIKWSEIVSPVNFEFDYKPDSDLQPNLRPMPFEEWNEISLFNSKFHYLSAERLGPRSDHILSDFHINGLNPIGKHGEFAVHYISEHGSKNLKIPAFKHPKANSNSLHSNIEAWMAEFTPGIKFNAITQSNSVNLEYYFIQGKDFTKKFKPQNVGFGLSYVLPVLTSILSSSKGGLLIIENPESHLHPAGHSLMGKLCVIAANNGVQLIIESHSDHFLNGIRVAVKQKKINSDDINLFFLQRDIESLTHATEVISPRIDERGRIDIWPDGFFDQWDKDLDQLL